MLDLPLKFILFWFPDAFVFFTRFWKNTLMVIEEDLAVGLMIKLFFVPLFADASIFGRMMSMCFRLTKIIMGLAAYAVVTAFFAVLSLAWFTVPVLLFVPFLEPLRLFFSLLIFFGVVLFIDRLINQPLKKIWQIKGANEIFKCTKVKKKNLSFPQLLSSSPVKNLLQTLEISENDLSMQPLMVNDQFFQNVYDLAKKTGSIYINEGHFFIAGLMQQSTLSADLMKKNLTYEDLIKAQGFLDYKNSKWRKVYLWDEDFSIKHLKGVNRGWLSAPTPTLDSVSTDLTKDAAMVGFPDFVGRQSTVSEVVRVLSQASDRNVLIIGPSGAGKSALVKYLAKMIVSGDAPDAIATKRLVAFDLARLISEIRHEGELAQRIKTIFDELKYASNTVLFVDEIHNLAIGDASGNFNMLALLTPYLESADYQFIGTTEEEFFSKILEKQTSFARIFHKIELQPATVEETVDVLKERAVDLARHKKITITFRAIQEIVSLSHKFIHDLVLPDSAVSVLNECEAAAKEGVIDTQVVKDIFSKRIQVPVTEINQNQREDLLNLESIIHEKMIDQVEAVQHVADTLRRGATGLHAQNRPIGSFLFVGPTGVGKTELAKILAETYFKSSGAFLRFDMSEYQSPDAVNRLLGSEQNLGELTQEVKNKPYSLLLLDEFEKANSQILTLFLQVLEEGRLTDYSGKHIDFTNTIIIATSNAASLQIAQGLQAGQSLHQLNQVVKDELLKVYKPELVNRFDEVVIFKPLSQEDLQKVVILKLGEVEKLLKDQGFLVTFSSEVIQILAQKGYDPVLGARPLRRLIQDTIESKLSKMILENKLIKGENFIVEAKFLS